MKTKILSVAAAIAISLSAVTVASTASARGGYPGLGHDYSYYQHGITERHYRAICKRLHYNWRVLGNPKAKELYFRWNCFRYFRGYGYGHGY